MIRRLNFVIGLVVCSVLSLHAQETTGIIRGTVTDPAGGLVTGATVTATGAETGAASTTHSDRSGAYSLPLLPPGRYSVSIEAPGFSKSIRNDIVVRITETQVADFSLKVGALSESVTITGDVTLVQTDSASEGRVIEHDAIAGLPLATRNFTQLLGLTAGVVTGVVNAETVGFGTLSPNVNGARSGSNNYQLDGIMNNNSMNNATAGVGTPSVDFLEEFKVITNMYSAEYGRNSGSVVNVVTRSGTDTLHGTFFEFLRNTDLVARDFFAQQRGQNVQNQFGATIGGPVIFPKVYHGKNRTFFFFGYEGLRQRNTNSSAAVLKGTVPTTLQRQGIFPGAVKDPTTGAPFADNTVPASRINPTSMQLLQQFVPLPNVSGSNNYIEQFGTPFNGNQFVYRIDHTLSANDRLMYRQFASYANQFTESGFLPGFGATQTFTNRQLTLTETHTFSPTLLNEARFGYYNYINPKHTDNTTDPKSVGIQPINPEPGLPGMIVTGYLSYGYTSNDFKDQISSFVYADTLSHVAGPHTFKYGTEIRLNQEQSFGIPFQGRFTFNGQYSGNPLADFLLGGPSQFVVANGPGKVDMRDKNFNFFIQDTWKVTKRLTLDLGLRYEYNKPVTETLLHSILNFYPQSYQRAGVNSGLVTGGVTPGVPAATYYSDWHNFAPRFGFAYALDSQSRTVVRGGFGIFFDTAAGQIIQQQLSQPPYAGTQTVIFGAGSALNGFKYPAPIDLSHPTVTIPGGNLTVTQIQEHMGSPYSEQWNFGIQHQFHGDWSLETSYVATRGVQLFMDTNINYPRGPNLLRPYSGFSTIMFLGSGLNSNYQSLQVTAQKRMKHGITLLAAYTFSKSLDDAQDAGRYFTTATGDPANLFGSWGPSSFDVPQRLVVSYVMQVPNPFGSRAHGAERILNGWEASGISTFESGTPFSITNSLSNLNHDGQAGAPGTGGRADAISGVQPVNPGPISSKLNGYLNSAAFSAAPATRYGTLGRNTVFGPGVDLWDIRISKNTRPVEKVNARFLAEFLNAFNHPAFANPGTVLGTAAFGTITSTLSNARIIQLALKFEY